MGAFKMIVAQTALLCNPEALLISVKLFFIILRSRTGNYAYQEDMEENNESGLHTSQ